MFLYKIIVRALLSFAACSLGFCDRQGLEGPGKNNGRDDSRDRDE